MALSSDGELTIAATDITYAQNAAAVDADADGEVELYLVLSDGNLTHNFLSSRGVDGSDRWLDLEYGTTYMTLSVHDLAGDGAPELIAAESVLDAATGELLFTNRNALDCINPSPAVGDLDLDGTQEFVLCDSVYDAWGNLLWQVPVEYEWYIQPVIVQADADPEGEVAFIHQALSVYDTDGTELVSTGEIGSAWWSGAACAGDMDGDGWMDLAWPTQDMLYAVHLDGTPLWMTPVTDQSSQNGCSVADLDGDGRVEVLYADEFSFGIYDGRTGTPLYLDPDTPSHTGLQFPVTADIDDDGHTEVLVAMGDYTTPGWPYLRVYRHAGEGWTPGGAIWPYSDYSVTDVNEDGTIPRVPEPAWNRYGVFRGRLASRDSYPLTAELTVTIDGVCVEDCVDGPVVVSLHVTNSGTVDLPVGTRLVVYAERGPDRDPVSDVVLPPLPATTASAGFFVELDPAVVAGGALSVTVDDDGTPYGQVREADETNNTATWGDVVCP